MKIKVKKVSFIGNDNKTYYWYFNIDEAKEEMPDSLYNDFKNKWAKDSFFEYSEEFELDDENEIIFCKLFAQDI